ncbi:MAG: hypothetical protein JNL74_00805, partial [Fibrobacteres bacterium]|nr:hypothetical protein [Fibrobacterota bacterium]
GLTGNFVIGSADTTITKAARDTLYSACRIKNEFNLYYIDTTRIVWDSSKTTP